jgi:hypothetical protein
MDSCIPKEEDGNFRSQKAKSGTISCLGQKKNMCVYGHLTHPIFQPPTLTFFISNYSTLIFANDPINFYTEFG